MINAIDIFNVGFGDCFVLKCKKSDEDGATPTENTQAMLVDCGSMKKIDNEVFKKLNNSLIEADKRYLMITHFHSDHYNNISKLCEQIKFDAVYLPNFFSESVIKMELSALVSPISATNPELKFAKNLLLCIPNIKMHMRDSYIQFVERGTTVYNETDEYRILWPEQSALTKKAQSTCRQIIDSLTDEDRNAADRLDKLITDAANNYLALFHAVNQRQDGINIIHEFSKEQANHCYVRSQAIIEGLKNESLSLINPKTVKKNIKSIINKISSFQNQVCICFDNYVDDPKMPVLFLSDIDAKTYEKYIADNTNAYSLREEYFAVKVPHHGTKDYFTDRLPKSKYMIISNGKYRKSWQITYKYGDKYPETLFICTNNDACEYILLNKSCKSFRRCHHGPCCKDCNKRTQCKNQTSICGFATVFNLRSN